MHVVKRTLFLLYSICVTSAMRRKFGIRQARGPKTDVLDKYIDVSWSRTESKCMNKCENDARCLSCEFDGNSELNCRCTYQARKQQKWFPKKAPSPDVLAVEALGEEKCFSSRNLGACENLCDSNKWCTHYRMMDSYDGLYCCMVVKPKVKSRSGKTKLGSGAEENSQGNQTKKHKSSREARSNTLICDRGSHDFENAEAPEDCQGESLFFGIEGKNRLNSFGLRYCFDTDTKISWYVQFMLRKDQTRAGYRRNGLLFKTNPRLGVCEQQAPSWYSCPHIRRGKKGSGAPNWCDWYRRKHLKLPKTCIDHPVQPAAVCNKMVFSGKQCNCPEITGKAAGGECSVDEAVCMGYSGYENRVCRGWGEDSDYDRGHLAASSDVFDDQEAAEVCDQVDGKAANVWDDPYEKGFNRSQWHRGDYAKCAWTASFLMTNVVPQGSLLNQICWRDIENSLKQYSEGKRDLFVVVGNSRNGMMRGQKTPLEDGYDPRSADNVLIPKFMWKIACTTTKPTKCSAWIVANRNLPVPEGCRTQLTLRQLKWLLNELGELPEDQDWIPGMQGWDSDTLLSDPDLEIKCENEYRPEYCNILGGKDWPETREDQSLKALNETAQPPEEIQLTCEDGDDCTDYCRCCDSEFLQILQAATATMTTTTTTTM